MQKKSLRSGDLLFLDLCRETTFDMTDEGLTALEFSEDF
jgi:hypothetical protein